MSCCRECNPVVRCSFNTNTIYKTLSIVPGTEVCSFVLPACVKKRKIFYVQVEQDLPTTSLPAEIQINCVQYPLINSCGEAVTTTSLKKGLVYLVALVPYSITNGIGCSYQVLSTLCSAAAPATPGE